MLHPNMNVALTKTQHPISTMISRPDRRNTLMDFLVESWMYYHKPGKRKFWKRSFGWAIDRIMGLSPQLFGFAVSTVKILEWDDAEITVKSWKDRALLNCEFAIPIDKVDQINATILRLISEFRAAGIYNRTSGWVLRTVAADTLGYLSPARHDSGLVVFVDLPYQQMDAVEFQFFRAVEAALLECGGRLSWARRANTDAESVLKSFGPQAEKFVGLLRELDPTGVFRNRMRHEYFGF
eukprot:c19885_g1_i3.p2 GENE.c19885_g1_i3~~c19885_g1_i3.p2  ORF type:complete len:238 (-),score=44.82 c19885_g1_i3:112-825(-)